MIVAIDEIKSLYPLLIVAVERFSLLKVTWSTDF